MRFEVQTGSMTQKPSRLTFDAPCSNQASWLKTTCLTFESFYFHRIRSIFFSASASVFVPLVTKKSLYIRATMQPQNQDFGLRSLPLLYKTSLEAPPFAQVNCSYLHQNVVVPSSLVESIGHPLPSTWRIIPGLASG